MFIKKSLRHRGITQDILDHGGIPNTVALAAKYGVTQRTIERDIIEILREIPRHTAEEIHATLMLRVKERLPKMSDVSLLKLLKFFKAEKSETKTEVTGGAEWKITVVDEVEDDRDEVEASPGPEDGAS